MAQEAFVTAFQKLGTFRGESSFKTWLLSITWRKAIDRRKSVTRWMRGWSPGGVRRTFESRPDPVDPAAGDRTIAGGRISDNDAAETASQADRVACRRSFEIRCCWHAPGTHAYDQIAAMLGIPVGTVKWRISEARRVLKHKLAAVGFEHE